MPVSRFEFVFQENGVRWTVCGNPNGVNITHRIVSLIWRDQDSAILEVFRKQRIKIRRINSAVIQGVKSACDCDGARVIQRQHLDRLGLQAFKSLNGTQSKNQCHETD